MCMLLWGINMKLDTLKRWVSDIFCEPDNFVVCPVRVMAVAGFAYSLGMHAWTIVVQHAQFDLQQFSTGYGIMMATLGAALKLKSDSSPDIPKDK